MKGEEGMKHKTPRASTTITYIVLAFITLIVMFPIYFMVISSFKHP